MGPTANSHTSWWEAPLRALTANYAPLSGGLLAPHPAPTRRREKDAAGGASPAQGMLPHRIVPFKSVPLSVPASGPAVFGVWRRGQAIHIHIPGWPKPGHDPRMPGDHMYNTRLGFVSEAMRLPLGAMAQPRLGDGRRAQRSGAQPSQKAAAGHVSHPCARPARHPLLHVLA